MKKIHGLLVSLVLAAMVSSGCQTAQAPVAATSIPVSAAASAVGSLAMAPLMFSSMGTSSSPSGISKLSTAAASFEADGWLRVSSSESFPGIGSISYDVRSKLFGVSTGFISNEAKSEEFAESGDVLSAIFEYAVFQYDLITPEVTSYTTTLGRSKTDPLKLESMNTVPSITGPASYSGAYGDVSLSVSIAFSGLTLDAVSGYPEGSVSFSVSSGSEIAYTGTISYNGTSTATIVFSGGGTYTVDLSSGEVS